MSTPVELAAIITPGCLAALGLLVTACAREWVTVSVSVSVRAVPGAKRKPRDTGAAGVPSAVPGVQAPDKTLRSAV